MGTLTEVYARTYPSREQHRSDCCDHCAHVETCTRISKRCWPRKELIEQCETCHPCSNFAEQDFKTALQLLEEGLR